MYGGDTSTGGAQVNPSNMSSPTQTIAKLKRALVVIFVVLGLFAPVLSTSFANADDSGLDTAYEKIKIYNAHHAYNILWESTSLENLVNNNPQIPLDSGSDIKDCHVPMPNTIIQGTSESSPKISCKDFLLGTSGWNAIMTAPGLSNSDYSGAADYLKKLGYRRPNMDTSITGSTTYNKGTSYEFVAGILGDGTARSLTMAEVYNIYNQYLSNKNYVEMLCGGDQDKNAGWMQVKVKRDGKIDDTCWVKEKQQVKYTGATGTSVGGYYFTMKDWSLKNIIDQINKRFDLELIVNDIDEIDDSDSAANTTSGANSFGPDIAGKKETTCKNSNGAGSLGWIVCSILDWMANATEDLYDGVVKPALNVEPELFTEGGNKDGTEAAWNVFRNFANIIFTILVLFVIFSQLTGVGIDNYGIKKILPKLIVTAVLINLSYFICLVCVDLSNIVGNGVQQLFNNMSSISQELNIKTIDGAETPEDASNTISVNVDGKNTSSNSSTSGVGITAVTVAGAAIGVYAIYSNPALLLTLFISVLGVLISILFVFILLAGRKAAIILLTVISPIAFIMYMLPNTKKIFDKWFNLWKAMLLVYPICGLLIGGGNFASQLMLNIGDTSNAVTAFTAMIVGIVPIFFIPTVIKNAYAALGSMGGAIAGFGNRLRGGATSGMRNSRLNQNAQKRSQDRSQRISAMRRAGVRLDKDGNVVESNRPTASLRRKMSGTWVGRRLGLEASMGQGAAEFTKLEAARRGNMAAGNNTNAMNATLAGLAEKESAQRISDQEVLMRAGKVRMQDGTLLNVNNADDMRAYHGKMLGAAHQAKEEGNTAAYNSYMDKVKAAQNIMATSDRGRQDIQKNYENAVGGSDGGLTEAARHLMGVHSSDIKYSNIGMYKFSQALIDGTNMSDIRKSIDTNEYDRDSISDYTTQSLASADDAALDRLAAAAESTNMNLIERRDLAKLIDDMHANKKNLNIQGKVQQKIDAIDRALGRTPSSW